ncbi:hypothetical protein [Stutzerimonas tarimensis]|uniref:Uncharacterized protein n=1 Tax=Stutzerimonas tarimensis TaxID=1507735 RepID=A0ABV7T1Y6_9GAMM
MISRPTFASRFIFFPALLVVLMLHFSLFGESTHNPIGIRPLNEAYLSLCIGFAILLMLAATEETSREFRVLMYYAVFTCAVFIVLPMIFSYFTYGQPFVYGFIEERRVLYCLGFAPLLYVGKRVTPLQFERALIYVALLAAVLSWGFKFGMVPDWRDEVASWDRPDRSSIGPYLMCLTFFYCVAIWDKGASPIDGSPRSKNLYLLFAAILLLTLVFATQTRQLIALCLVFAVFYLRAKVLMWGVMLAVLLAPLYIYPELLQIVGIDLGFYDEQFESGVEDGVRPYTIASIFMHLDQVNWLPSGSLSLMWQGGFVPYFGEHFFLTDVGIFGLLFKYGFLTFLIVPITLFFYRKIAKAIDDDMSFIYPAVLALICIWPLAGLLAYNQATIAFLLVMHSLKAQHQRSKEQVYEYRSYPKLQGSY